MKARAILDTIVPYEVEEDILPVIMDANEYPCDLPPVVKREIMERMGEISFNRYPNITGLDLRKQLAAEFGLRSENVFLGNGSSQLLQILCFIFANKERSVVYPSPSFSMYGIYAKLADSAAKPVELEADFSLDCDKLLKMAEKENAGIILLCNPNNPTGAVLPPEDIEYIVSGASCPVVVDEAYQEFYGVSAVDLLSKYPNLIIARTFSKAYSLASCRVGYILAAPEIMTLVLKCAMPYALPTPSLAAAAAVLQMKDIFKERIAETIDERRKLSEALADLKLGVKVFPSKANFVLIKTENAAALAKWLKGFGISVRAFSGNPAIGDCLRITVGTKKENELLLDAIKSFKG